MGLPLEVEKTCRFGLLHFSLFMQLDLLLAQQASMQMMESALLKELSIRPSDSSLQVLYVNFLKVSFRVFHCMHARHLSFP